MNVYIKIALISDKDMIMVGRINKIVLILHGSMTRIYYSIDDNDIHNLVIEVL